MIPRPEKGVAGNGFNLQEAMGLADDAVTYAVLRVSPPIACGYLSLMICSVLSGTWQPRPGSTVQSCGIANPKTSSVRLLERYVYYSTIISSFLKYSRHENVTAILRGSRMVGLLKNSSSRILRTNARMHANEGTWEIKLIKVRTVATEAREAMATTVIMGSATMAAMTRLMVSWVVTTTRSAVTTGPVVCPVWTTMTTTAARMGTATTTKSDIRGRG